jgi:hypothetical protein
VVYGKFDSTGNRKFVSAELANMLLVLVEYVRKHGARRNISLDVQLMGQSPDAHAHLSSDMKSKG